MTALWRQIDCCGLFIAMMTKGLVMMRVPSLVMVLVANSVSMEMRSGRMSVWLDNGGSHVRVREAKPLAG